MKYLPSQIAPAIAGLVAIPIITRLFPPADYGNYVLVMATVSVLSTIVSWLSMSIVRFYSAYERDNRLQQFYSSGLKILFISVVILTSVFLSVLFFISSNISSQLLHLMLIGAIVFILSSAFSVIQNFLRARRQVKWYAGFVVWHSIAALGIGIALIIGFNFAIQGLLWGHILSLAVALPLLWKVVVRGKSALSVKGISAGLTKEMAKYGFPLVAANLAAWILSLSDRYVLEIFRGAKEVGIYSIAYTISERSILLIASLFWLASVPIEMNIWEKQGEQRSREFVSNVTRYYLIICFPSMVGLSVLSKLIIKVLTEGEYYEGYRIISLIAVGAFLLGLQRRFTSGLTFYKKTNLVFFGFIASGALNIGLNVLFVPKYGYMAAAVTTIISYAFLLTMMVVASRKYFVWNFPFKTLVRVASASAVMGAVIHSLGRSLTYSALAKLIVCMCVGATVYFVILFLLKEFQTEEIQELRKIRSRMFARRKE